MKKSICIALSIATVLSLCACGAKETSVETPVSEVSVEASVEAPVSEVSVEEVVASVEEVEASVEEVVEEPVVEEPQENVIQFADKIEFAQVGVPQIVHINEYCVDENGDYIKFSDFPFESEFTLLSSTAYEDGDNIIYEIMFTYDLSNWDYDHDRYSSLMNIFDLETETEIEVDESPVDWHYELGEFDNGNPANYFVITVPKDMHIAFYLCADIHEDDYAIEQFEGMGPEVSWAIAHFKTTFIDLNPELVNAQ